MRNRLKNIMIIGTSAILFTGLFNSIQAGSIDTNINHINITDTEQQATQSSTPFPNSSGNGKIVWDT